MALQVIDSVTQLQRDLTVAEQGEIRTGLGLGTSATTAATAYATAVQGGKADTAIQPAGMASAMIDARQGMTSAQRLEFAGVSDAATQPSAVEFVWWTAPNGSVWNSNGSAWTQIV